MQCIAECCGRRARRPEAGRVAPATDASEQHVRCTSRDLGELALGLEADDALEVAHLASNGAAGCRLQAWDCRLQAAGVGLQAAGWRRGAAGWVAEGSRPRTIMGKGWGPTVDPMAKNMDSGSPMKAPKAESTASLSDLPPSVAGTTVAPSTCMRRTCR